MTESAVFLAEIDKEIAEKIAHLGEFLGAKEAEYNARVPKVWKYVSAKRILPNSIRHGYQNHEGLDLSEFRQTRLVTDP